MIETDSDHDRQRGFSQSFTPQKKGFLAAFSRCGSLGQAAKRAGVDRRTHHNWLRSDHWYVEAFHQAVQEAGDALEDKLNEMPHDGNTTAAIFLLKGLRPEKYKDRQAHEVVWDGDPTKLTDAQLEKMEDTWRRAGRSGDDRRYGC